jgi:hypothetical protein
MARICITYLMFTVFEDSLIDDTTTWNANIKWLTQNHGYLDYTASFWATNFKNAQKSAPDMILQSVLKLCNTRSRWFQAWFNVYWNRAYPDVFTPR